MALPGPRPIDESDFDAVVDEMFGRDHGRGHGGAQRFSRDEELGAEDDDGLFGRAGRQHFHSDEDFGRHGGGGHRGGGRGFRRGRGYRRGRGWRHGAHGWRPPGPWAYPWWGYPIVYTWPGYDVPDEDQISDEVLDEMFPGEKD